MRRIAALAALLLILCGCAERTPAGETGSPAPALPVTAEQAVQAVVDSQADLAGLSLLSEEDRDFYLAERYGLEEDLWTEAAVCAASGVDAREIAVLRLSDPEDGEAVLAALERYRQSRLGDFFGYAPDQAALVEGGGAVWVEGCAALLICGDRESAEDILTACLSGELPTVPEPTAAPSEPAAGTPADTPAVTAGAEPEDTPPVPADTPPAAVQPPVSTGTPEVTPSPAETAAPPPTAEPTPAAPPTPTVQVLNPDLDISGFPAFHPPNEFDMSLYDTTAIRTAYAGGDASGLSEKDAAILDKCREVLAEYVTPEMSDFEKELALHDWLVANCSYDQRVHNIHTPKGLPDNTNPYGPLVGGYGICLGYATAFQLLMDLSGVECITVVGASSDSTSDHAWNMVRLDGEWYCVDPTWDDPVGNLFWTSQETLRLITHRYFNVTSDDMRASGHQWDYFNVPETAATRFFWNGSGTLPS